MHWVDLVIVGVIVWTAFSAFRAGLIREVTALLAVVLGAYVAGRLYTDLSSNLEFLIEDPATRNLIAFVSLFAGIVVLGQITAALLSRVAGLLMLGPLDHLAGAGFGLLKGVLIVAVLLLAASRFPASSGLRQGIEESSLAPFFLDHVPIAERLLPSEFQTGTTPVGPAPGVTTEAQPLPGPLPAHEASAIG